MNAYRERALALVGDADPLEVQAGLTDGLQAAFAGASEAAQRRMERPGGWCMLDVLEHLVDAEIHHAWRYRVVLEHERPALPAWNPELYKARSGYGSRPVSDLLVLIDGLRRRNLDLLRTLDAADLSRTGIHGRRGEESLGLMVALVAGHDRIHLAQLERIRAAGC